MALKSNHFSSHSITFIISFIKERKRESRLCIFYDFQGSYLNSLLRLPLHIFRELHVAKKIQTTKKGFLWDFFTVINGLRQ